jgi:hypothetical protein
LLAVKMLAEMSGRKVTVSTYILGKVSLSGKIELPVRETMECRPHMRQIYT